MKNFIRYFLILTFMCVLPVFVLADEAETASIKITKNLLNGAGNGTFTFMVTDTSGNSVVGENGIQINTANINTTTISNLLPNTEYIVEETLIPPTHKFVSIKSGDKIILNAHKIKVKTGNVGTTTEVVVTNASSTSNVLHDKQIESNHDGTHKLSLSVTGSADTTVSTTKANVLIVYDTSASMKLVDDSSFYLYTDNPKPDQSAYGYINGQYKLIRYIKYGCENPKNGEYYNCWREGAAGNGNEYTGDVYLKDSKYKATHAEKSAYDFAKRLFESSGNNVNMALVTFNDNVNERQAWTTNKDTFLNNFSGTNENEDIKLSYSGETNWQKALIEANATLAKLNASNQNIDQDYVGKPTYVVFITDGVPTACASGTVSCNGKSNTKGYYEAALPAVKDIRNVATIFGIYAFGSNIDYLDDLIYYANSCKNGICTERNNVSDLPVPTTNYYNAKNTTQLNAAVDDIFYKIVNTAGFSNVSISDGTTSQVQVQASTGEMSSLLNVDDDPNSYEYWLSIPVENATSDGHQWKFKKTDRRSGTDYWVYIDITSGNVATAKWYTGPSENLTEHTVTLNGSVKNNIFKYRWTEANELYDYAPPQATYHNGALDWDLASVGTLLNGVTYTVTFNVWPTQYTSDLITDLINGTITYDSLPDNVRDYIIESNGTYKLRTNTEALLTYTDTRTSDTPQTTTFDNPPSVETEKELVNIEKKWENDLDPTQHGKNEFEQIDINLNKNGILHETIALTKNSSWKNNIYISPGLMKTINGKAISLEVGNDYTFTEGEFHKVAESTGEGYHWELKADTIRPMVIDGIPLMLIKLDETSDEYKELTQNDINTLDNNYFLTKGTDKYYKICHKDNNQVKCLQGIYKVGNSNNVIIKNVRRSNLNLTKEIIGENAPTDKEFIFKLTVTDANSEDIYFSTYDLANKTNVTNNVISGTKEPNANEKGYFIVESGKPVLLKLKTGWNLRFTNLPIGSTYTIKEVLDSNTPAGFKFDSITITPNDSNNKITVPLLENYKITKSNTLYTVTYINKYELTEVTVTKEWVINGEENIPNDILDTINASKTATIDLMDGSIVVDTKTLTKDNTTEDNNIWSYIWTNIPKGRYNDKGEFKDIIYSVREIKVNNLQIDPDDGKFYITNDNIHAVIGAWVPSTSGLNITNTWESKPTTMINLIKKGFGTNSPLQGAVFVLYKYIGNKEKDPNYNKNIDLTTNDETYLSYLNNNWLQIGSDVISNEDGLIIISNLYEGEYRLIEVSPPDGYILPSGQWRVLANPSDSQNPIEYTGLNHPPVLDKYHNIYNEKVPTMPSTGGLGTLEISLIGLFLMMIGTIALIISQKEQI